MPATSALTFAEVRVAVPRWLRRNLPRAIMMSAVSFVFGWAVNVFLLAWRYQGFAVPPGTKQLATGQGSMLGGTIFWAAASSIFFAMWTYTRRVGLAKVMADLRSLPVTVRESLAGDQRNRTLATLSWGAAISLLAALVIGPAAAGAVAVALAVFATTPVGPLVAGVLRRLWMAVLFKFSPTAGAPLDGVTGAIVSAVGTAAGMAVAFLLVSPTFKIALALAAIALAWWLVGRESPPAAATVILGVVGGLFLLDLLDAAMVFADDGGWSECGDCSPIDWVRSEGAGEVLGRGVVGGTAAAVGAPVGAAIGDLLAGGGESGGEGGDTDPDEAGDGGEPDPSEGAEEATTGEGGEEAGDQVPTEEQEPATVDEQSESGAVPPKPTGRPPGAEAGDGQPGAEPERQDATAPPAGPDTTPATEPEPGAGPVDPAEAAVLGGEVAVGSSTGSEEEPGWTDRARDHINTARDALESDPEDANSWFGWTRNVLVGTLAGIAGEVVDVPNQVADAAVGAAEIGGKVIDEVTDPENWKVVVEGTRDTVKDVVSLVVPGESTDGAYDKIVEGAKWTHDRIEDAGTIAGTLVAAAEHDPAGAIVTVVETILNKDNWDKAMDPDVPILERAGRAVWGAIDNTMTLVGLGGAGLGALDKAGDMLRGGKALDDGLDAARAGGVLDDLARSAASGADEAAVVVNKADDAAVVATKADDATTAATKADDAAAAATKADRPPAAAATTADDAAAAATKADRPPAAAATTAGDAAAAATKADDAAAATTKANRPPPTHKELAEQRIRDLDEGAIVDSNFITDTGYTGRQINGDGPLVSVTRADGTEVLVHDRMGINDITKKHDIIAETRTTNFDSMARVRDGDAVPKPLEIKSKTIGADDTRLGFRAEDQGLVGYKQPTRPNPAEFDDPAEFKNVMDRFNKRDIEYRDKSMDMFKLEQEGKVFVDRQSGVVYDVTTKKPYAGDIDAVVFKNPDGTPVGRDKYLEVMDDWTSPNNAVRGQHGAEAQMINDLTSRYGRGTPEFNAAMDKAMDLHGTLEDAHKTEQVIQFSGGVARKGPNYYESGLPADVTPEIQGAIDAARAARRAGGS